MPSTTTKTNAKKSWKRNNKFNEDTTFVKILMPVALWDDLKEIAVENDRQYSDQVRFFLRQGIEAYQSGADFSDD